MRSFDCTRSPLTRRRFHLPRSARNRPTTALPCLTTPSKTCATSSRTCASGRKIFGRNAIAGMSLIWPRNVSFQLRRNTKPRPATDGAGCGDPGAGARWASPLSQPLDLSTLAGRRPKTVGCFGPRQFLALMARNTAYSHFGASVSAALAERRLSQIDLATALGRPAAYVNQTMTGVSVRAAYTPNVGHACLGPFSLALTQGPGSSA